MDLGFSKGSSSEASPEKLRQLSEEVNRIAASIARLATASELTTAQLSDSASPSATHSPVKIEAVRSAIKARRLRSKFFDSELFAEPAWDMLLDLFQSELSQLRVPVSSLCVASLVPATTALRWIARMTEAGLFTRRPDPHDGRRFFVELTPQASEAMRHYFVELRREPSE